ncbi:MAG: hypothetical protein ACRC8P_00430 [Spiroplasma sp.]
MSKRKIPKTILLPKISYSKKFIDVLIEQYEIHWSTKKGSYKDNDGKNHDVSLDEVIYYNSFSKLALTVVKLANLFNSPMQYFHFWNIKLNVINQFKYQFFPNNDFKSLEFTWFSNKIGSASSVFLNELTILLETIFVFSNKKLFDSSTLKNALIIHSYSIIEVFIISVNAIYVVLNKKGAELTEYDQLLNKIRNFSGFKKSELLEQEFSQEFKNNYQELSKIRNVIVHPFSYKENKKNYSYWQIQYVDNLNLDEIILTKMNETSKKSEEWIVDFMKFNPYEKKKYNIMNIINELLSELLNYFEKLHNDEQFKEEIDKWKEIEKRLKVL